MERYLLGRRIYMEISPWRNWVRPGREMILGHPDAYVLFGTDFPRTDQAGALALLRNLYLPQERLQQILADNALSLLNLTSIPLRRGA